MKKLLTILCLVLLVSCSPPPEVPSHRLIMNGGMTFEISSNDPFTGVSIKYHHNNQLSNRTNYKNGEQHGLEERFHENGQLYEREEYRDGKNTVPGRVSIITVNYGKEDTSKTEKNTVSMRDTIKTVNWKQEETTKTE